MSTATFTSNNQLRANLSELIKAARTFAQALFAAQERQFVKQEVVTGPLESARTRINNHNKLIAMANRYQDRQPSLAAELRGLAGRD